MKNLILLFLILFYSKLNFAQKKYLENNCDYNFNNCERARNINIKYFVPCLLIEDESSYPDLLKKYTYYEDNGDFLTYTIGLKKLNNEYTNAESMQAFSKENLNKIGSGWGEVVSTRNVKISNKISGEVVFDAKMNNPNRFARNLVYLFTYKKYLITIAFSVSSESQLSCVRTFNNIQPAIIHLILKTIVLE